MKNAIISIIKRWSKPLTGLAIAGVSTTLVACYGVEEPSYDSMHTDYCESILLSACADDTVNIPEDCSDFKKEDYCQKDQNEAGDNKDSSEGEGTGGDEGTGEQNPAPEG